MAIDIHIGVVEENSLTKTNDAILLQMPYGKWRHQAGDFNDIKYIDGEWKGGWSVT